MNVGLRLAFLYATCYRGLNCLVDKIRLILVVENGVIYLNKVHIKRMLGWVFINKFILMI